MKKIIYLLICLFLVQCQKSKTLEVKDIADVLLGCMTDNDIELLSEGVTIFEKHLKQVYGENDTINIEVYRKYLESLSTMSFDRSFFQYTEAKGYLIKLKSLEIFKSLYKVYEEPEYDNSEIEVPITSRDATRKEDKVPDFYVLDQKGDFSSCLRSKATFKSVKDYFNSLYEISDISPTIKADAFLEILKTSNEDLELIKLSIAFDLYFNSILIINKI